MPPFIDLSVELRILEELEELDRILDSLDRKISRLISRTAGGRKGGADYFDEISIRPKKFK